MATADPHALPPASRSPSRDRNEETVEHGLRWLAAHQSRDGGWEAEGFFMYCDGKFISGDGPDGRGRATYDVGVTGLALLAFLGAGYTNRSEGPFGKVVGNGLKYLRNVQDVEGAFGNRSTGHFVYNHAIASLAMVEAYGMTGSAIYKSPTQRALDFIAISRNPHVAWRYGVRPGDNDTSVTGWMMLALTTAKLINSADVKANKQPSLSLDEEAFDGIKSWIEEMTDPEYGRVGYQQRGSGSARPTESMTAVGMLARILLGENPKTSGPIKKGADLCMKLVPTWDPNDGSIDMYFWFWGAQALYQLGGHRWDTWSAALLEVGVAHQRADGEYCSFKGSWDPVDRWGPDGGRVYSTALTLLALETPYRCERIVASEGR